MWRFGFVSLYINSEMGSPAKLMSASYRSLKVTLAWIHWLCQYAKRPINAEYAQKPPNDDEFSLFCGFVSLPPYSFCSVFQFLSREGNLASSM